jgi:tRNA G18 (ribose-2'-O)-methylase SpoU
MNRFVHHRHKPPAALAQARELVVALPPMRSNVNVSRIVRSAGCFGVAKIVVCGSPKIDPKIARSADSAMVIDKHRSLPPVLKKLKSEGYQLVGLEQTTGSSSLYTFRFDRRTVLVVGHERLGLTDPILKLVDHVVEIPIYGLPYSHNAATAAAIAMYEYCRQFPEG